MKTVAGIQGVVSVAIDDTDKKMTVIGDADPVCVTASLRKIGFAELVSVGPSKEPEKKPDDKKPPEKKPDDKKPPEKKQEASQTNLAYVILPTSCHYCSDDTYYFSEENPNACRIV